MSNSLDIINNLLFFEAVITIEIRYFKNIKILRSISKAEGLESGKIGKKVLSNDFKSISSMVIREINDKMLKIDEFETNAFEQFDS